MSKVKKPTNLFWWQFDDEIGAYHEAGHLLIAILSRCDVAKATLRKTFVWLDESDFLIAGRTSLAGPLAECIHRGVSDFEFRYAVVDRWVHEEILALQNFEQCQADYDQECQQVRNKLVEYWPAVEALAMALIEQGQLTGEEARKIIEEATDES